MRLYHFLKAEHGLSNIAKRRLKISQLDNLNDPFELFSIELSDRVLRGAARRTKEQMARDRGILCFSSKWSNPVQWSHYADRHKGLCLSFEVPKELTRPVTYSAKRLKKEARQLATPGAADETTMMRLLTTKFIHWRYENEVRCFVDLRDRDPGTGLYFADFSDSLRLVQVIVGPASDTTRGQVADALGALAASVDAFKARLAFRSFKVVRNKDESLWD
jgi:hypothetical protein